MEERGAARAAGRFLHGDVEEELPDGNDDGADGGGDAELRVRGGGDGHVGVGLEAVEEKDGNGAGVVANLRVRRRRKTGFVDEALGDETVGHGVEVGGGDDAGEAADGEGDERVEGDGGQRDGRVGDGGDADVEEAGDEVAGGLQGVGRAVDVGDAVREVVVEDVEEACESGGDGGKTGNHHEEDALEGLCGVDELQRVE